MVTLTMFLVLTTCNTWTGKCLPKERVQWSVSLPDWGDRSAQVAHEIEVCRQRGVDRAHKLTALQDPNGNRHFSTNVQCKYEFGSGT